MFIPLRPESGSESIPWGTLIFMGCCVLVFAATRNASDEVVRSLSLGLDDFEPLQWFTSVFVHEDLWQLVVNLLFLFSFGLIVENLSGTGWFLVLILSVAALSGLIIQAVGFFMTPSPDSLDASFEAQGDSASTLVLGSSEIVFSLMAAALVWAPSSRLVCYAGWRLRGNIRPVSIKIFVLLWVLVNLIQIAALGSQLFTEASMHLIGLLSGAAVAWILLATGRIDTQGWHAFGVKHRQRRGL